MKIPVSHKPNLGYPIKLKSIMSTGKVRENALSNYYSVESHLLSGPWADAYKAIEKSSSRPVCLWMFRSRLQDRAGADDAFLERIALLSAEVGSLASIQRYGVDSSGVAFATIPSLDGRNFIGGTLDVVEAERRFLSALRIVEQIHKSGIVLGDISEHSFFIDRSGTTRLIGIMGGFSEFFSDEDSKIPHPDSRPYAPPEGYSNTQTCDVYSLAVLGVKLFTGNFPSTPFNGLKNTRGGAAPGWTEIVFSQALSKDPTGRYGSAIHFHQAIADVRGKLAHSSNVPAVPLTGAPVVRRAPRESQLILGPSVKTQTERPEEVKADESQNKIKPVLLLGGLCAIISLGLALLYLDTNKNTPVSSSANPIANSTTSQNTESSVDLSQLEAELLQLSQSADPLALSNLIDRAIQSPQDAARQLIEGAMLERARRLGGLRVAEQVRRWLKETTSVVSSPLYRTVLQLLEPKIPASIFKQSIETIYSENKDLGIFLTTASVLDGRDDPEINTLLSKIVSDSLPNLPSEGKHPLSLILAHPVLSQEFGEDVIQRRTTLPPEDIIWLIGLLGERHDVAIRTLASLAIQQKTLPAIRNKFLELLRDRGDLPASVTRVLAKASLGTLDATDLNSLGSWKDRDLEKVLIAVLASYTDSSILNDAFDLAAATTVTTEPAASLMRWIREKHWKERARLAPMIGALTYPQEVGDEEIEKAFEPLSSFGEDKSLVDIIFRHNVPQASLAMVRRYPNLIGVPRALNLLMSPSAEVRLAAIGLLKDTNDLGAMKLIVDRYESEKEPSVKQKFKDTFWFIKNRNSR